MTTLTTTIPAVEKHVSEYDRITKDYHAYVRIDGGKWEYIGSRPSQGACDILCDAYAYQYYVDHHTPEVAARIAAEAFDPIAQAEIATAAIAEPETCDGVEYPCGKPAKHEYRGSTGYDMETARPVSLWYCDACWSELQRITALADDRPAAKVNWSSSPLAQIARSENAISAVLFELALTDPPALVEFLRAHTPVQRDHMAWRFAAWLRRHHSITREPAHIAAGWAALIVGASACGAPRTDVGAGREVFRQWCQDRKRFVRTLAQLDVGKRRELAESYVAFLKSVSPTDLNPARMLYRWQREIDRTTAVERGA